MAVTAEILLWGEADNSEDDNYQYQLWLRVSWQQWSPCHHTSHWQMLPVSLGIKKWIYFPQDASAGLMQIPVWFYNSLLCFVVQCNEFKRTWWSVLHLFVFLARYCGRWPSILLKSRMNVPKLVNWLIVIRICHVAGLVLFLGGVKIVFDRKRSLFPNWKIKTKSSKYELSTGPNGKDVVHKCPHSTNR